jgi:hypothetical protein
MGQPVPTPAPTPAPALATGPQPDRSPRWWTLAALLTLLSLIPRWPLLTQSLWWDETLRTRLFLDPSPELAQRLADRLFRDVHNPLYNLIMAGWIRIAGDSEIAIRLPSIAFTLAAALLLARLIRRVISPTAGLCVLAFLLFNPVLIWYSATAKNNALVLLTTSACLVAFHHLASSPSARKLLLATAAATLALATSWLALLILIPLALLDPRNRPDATPDARGLARLRASVPSCLRAFLLALILVSPLILYKASNPEHLWRGYPRPFTPEELALFLGNYTLTGNALQPGDPVRWDAAAVVSLAVALPLLLLGWRALRTRCRAVPLAALGIPALLTAASLALRFIRPGTQIYQERNLILIIPALAALLVAGSLSLRPRWLRPAALAALLASQFVATMLMVTTHRDAWTVFWPTPDWRGAADWIRRDQLAGDELSLTTPQVFTNSLLEPLEYDQLRHGPLPPLRRPRHQAGERIADLIAADPPPPVARTIYVLSDRYWWPLTDAERDELDRRYPRTNTIRLRGLDVYRYIIPAR